MQWMEVIENFLLETYGVRKILLWYVIRLIIDVAAKVTVPLLYYKE